MTAKPLPATEIALLIAAIAARSVRESEQAEAPGYLAATEGFPTIRLDRRP